MSEALTELAHHGVPCPYCGAQPGQWCRTVRTQTQPPGQRATFLHAMRTRLVRDAWRIGYQHGEAYGYRRAANLLHRQRQTQQADDLNTTFRAIEEWLDRLADAVDG